MARAGELGDDALGTGAVDVDEADARALAAELLDQRRADPARAAGDQDAAVDQARVAREWG